MKKNEIKGYIILAVLFIVFSVVSFAPPFTKNAGFWCAYLFGVIAIVLQLYVFKISFQNEDAKSRFYGFPIAKIGVIYMIVQLVVSVVAMMLTTFVKSFPNWIFTIINILILGAAVIGCITVETMRDEIVRQDVSLKQDVSAMRNLESIISSVVSLCENDESKKILNDLAEQLKYSDPVACLESKVIEEEMTTIAVEIQKATTEGNIDDVKNMCTKMKALLTERNRICKVSK